MSEIQMKPVTSSQIAALGYDAATQRLHIRFANKADGSPGSLYEYANVDEATFLLLDGADSVGSTFYRLIKPHPQKFPYVRIDVITVLEALRSIGKAKTEEWLLAYMNKLPDEVKKDDRVPKAFKERRDALKTATA